MTRCGVPVIALQTGDPDFATPPVIIEAAHQAMKDGLTHYAASRGLPELRQAISDKLKRENNISADPDTEILVTQGAAHAIFMTMQTLLEPGDEVLLIEPFYPSYASSIRLAGGVPVSVETDPQTGFALDVAAVKASLSPRTRLLILNSPCNPTGIVLSEEDMESLVRLAAEHGLYILADEVYEKLLYGDSKVASPGAIPEGRDRAITINSLSKTYAMTGWRVGYVVSPADIASQMLKVLQFSATNIAPFVQRAAAVALTTPELSGYIEIMRRTYDERRQAALATVAELDGLRGLNPQGAFYLMLDVSRFCQDSSEFAYRLLEQAHVAAVPGVEFGKSAEGWLRLTFATEQNVLLEGIVRIGEFAHAEYGA